MWNALSSDFRRLNAQYGFGGLGDAGAFGACESGQPRDCTAERDDWEALASWARQFAIDEHVVDFPRAAHPERMNPVALHKIASDQSCVGNFRSVEHRDGQAVGHRRIRGG